jgi:hypothetical protein
MFIASCEKVLDEKIEYWDTKVVLHGYLYPNKKVKVWLHESKLHELEGDGEYISPFKSLTEAEVELYEEGRFVSRLQYVADSTFYYPFNYHQDACFISQDFKPMSGRKYTIKVITEEHPLVEASTHIPEPTAILSLTSERILKKIDSRLFEYNRCILTFEDNPDQEDYYGFSSKTVPGRTGNNVGFLGQDPGIEYPPLFKDHIIINDAYNLILDGYFNGSYMPGDIDTIDAAVQLLTVTRDHYLYHKSILESKRRDSLPYLQDIHLPITEPIQVYTNVKNGLGLFTGIAYDADTVQTIFYHHNNPIK